MTVLMKPVYELAKELLANPGRVALTQAVTLNPEKPEIGLKGSKGLFGSTAWWESIQCGRIQTTQYTGVVSRAYCAGQGDAGPNNMIDIITVDGKREAVGIYVNDPADVRLFNPGHQIEVIYALDELKAQPAPDGKVNYSRIAINMSVSEQPVK